MYTQATAGRRQIVEIATITEIPFKIRRMTKKWKQFTIVEWIVGF